MKKRITIGDVAAAAGVSKQTVSRAINDKKEISLETKERIMRIVRELGYRPKRLAQAMNSQRTRMVGLIVSDITNAFFPEVARGTQDAAMAQDYITLIVNTDDNASQEMKMLELMAEQAVDGIISFTHHIDEMQLLEFAEGYRPIVMINRDVNHSNISTINVDNQLGAKLAVEHLIEQGHRHIVMLSNSAFKSDTTRRVRGYMETVERHNLPHYVYPTKSTSDGGYNATIAILRTNPEVTAIFCYNDMMAIGVLKACHENGISVPQELAVVGFDGVQLTENVNPPLSSIYVDKYELGRMAFERVLELINDTDKSLPPLDIKPSLIIRESSRH